MYIQMIELVSNTIDRKCLVIVIEDVNLQKHGSIIMIEIGKNDRETQYREKDFHFFYHYMPANDNSLLILCDDENEKMLM